MELTITNNREIRPYKVSVKQYEAGTTTMRFTREGYMYDQIDLRQYTAYAVTYYNNEMRDMTELETEVVDNNPVITWVIQEQTLRQAGNITYQIVFKESALDGEGTGVFYTYEALLQNSVSVDSDRPIAANYPTILKQWLERMEAIENTIVAGIIYMPVGQPIPVVDRSQGRLYYQIENADTMEGHFENNLGVTIGAPVAKLMEDADVNKLISMGEYVCTGNITNAPIDCTFCVVRVTDTPTTDRMLQEVFVVADDNTVRTFTRAITGYDQFGAWVEPATSQMLDGFQEKIDKKQDKITGAATTITDTNLPVNKVLVSDASGKVGASNITLNELGYLDGVDSNVQQQLDGKADGELFVAGNDAKMITGRARNTAGHYNYVKLLDWTTPGSGSKLMIKGVGSYNTNALAERIFEYSIDVTSSGNSPYVAGKAHVDTLWTLPEYELPKAYLVNTNDGTNSSCEVWISLPPYCVFAFMAITDDKCTFSIPEYTTNDEEPTTDYNYVLIPEQHAPAVIGEIKWVGHNTLPPGYLLCDGSAVSRTKYAGLFATIGTLWGAGNGSTTFNLPNLMNKTVWGGTTAGSYKTAGLPNITGGFCDPTTYSADSWGWGALAHYSTGATFSHTGHTSDTRTYNAFGLNASYSNAIYGNSSTVQPPAAVLRPIIKY